MNKNDLHVVAIIPARGGSKGLPGKNVRNFCGKPLLAWSIIQCLESQMVDDVYVSSDCDQILSIAESYGAIPIKRPDEFATDTSTSEEALFHALDNIEKKVDIVVFLQATSPLREVQDIDGAINAMIDQEADSLFSSALLEDFFIFEKEGGSYKSVNFDYTNRPRRQDVTPQYLENGSMYLFKPEVLHQNNNRLGGRIGNFEMDLYKATEIDSKEDWDLCEWFMRRKILPSLNILKKSDIDLIVYDFDGVMTDNRATFMQDGKEAVIVNRGDGQGVNLIREKGIEQTILSTEENPVVTARANKLKLDVIQNAQNKFEILKDVCQKRNVDFNRVLYVGNDVNDLECMQTVGFPIAPNDAHPKIKEVAKIILESSGGAGVVRELADKIKEDL